MKKFPNKMSIIFISGFFILYLTQQPTKREDWPFSYFGMYKGGRYPTKPLFKFQLKYRDFKHKFSPYELPVDYYFIDENLREVILGTKEAINNDLISLGKTILPDKKKEVDTFLRSNIFPLIKAHCKTCDRGSLELHIEYWEFMSYGNFKRPDKKMIYTKLKYEL